MKLLVDAMCAEFGGIRTYVDHLLDCFGPGRLLWGSDWPVVELAGGYEKWWQATETLLAGIEDDERTRILGLNAVEFYRLDAKA